MGKNEKNKWLCNYLLLDIPSPFSRRLPTHLPKPRCRYHILLVGFRRIPEVMGGWHRGCGGEETVRGLRKCRDSVMWYISAEDAPPVACRVVDSDRPYLAVPYQSAGCGSLPLGGIGAWLLLSVWDGLVYSSGIFFPAQGPVRVHYTLSK